MKMLLVTILSLFINNQINYRTEFTFDYDWAVKFMTDNKELFLEKSQKYKTDNAIITSVVFPELIRYSIFKNYFETKGLELIYVQHGKDYADYSIGYFQMKPSFVEMLEDYVISNDSLLRIYSHIISFKHHKPAKIRSERIARLKNIEWQVEYLNCFFSVARHRFPDVDMGNSEEKIRFYATAYNHGFDKPAGEIRRWTIVAIFPYGMNSKARQHVYSDISVHYYKTRYSEIFKD
ncbi:MAG: hypothetical protein JXB00_15495 [Bacteroidales bacterium]|nr:hypothetical protein [Bacteroidales bacterium]